MYNVPAEAWLTNPDNHTIQINEGENQSDDSLGVTANQTTAIRIDDTTVHKRETWSSEKITTYYEGFGRVQFGTTAQWESQSAFVPVEGEFIVYTDRSVIDGTAYAGIKIGDGVSLLSVIPFVGDDVAQGILSQLNSHTGNSDIHVTASDKVTWNNKLNYRVEGEKLIFTRS